MTVPPWTHYRHPHGTKAGNSNCQEQDDSWGGQRREPIFQRLVPRLGLNWNLPGIICTMPCSLLIAVLTDFLLLAIFFLKRASSEGKIESCTISRWMRFMGKWDTLWEQWQGLCVFSPVKEVEAQGCEKIGGRIGVMLSPKETWCWTPDRHKDREGNALVSYKSFGGNYVLFMYIFECIWIFTADIFQRHRHWGYPGGTRTSKECGGSRQDWLRRWKLFILKSSLKWLSRGTKSEWNS